jgi:hypothetical protein
MLRATGGKPRSELSFDVCKLGFPTCHYDEQSLSAGHLVGPLAQLIALSLLFAFYRARVGPTKAGWRNWRVEFDAAESNRGAVIL